MRAPRCSVCPSPGPKTNQAGGRHPAPRPVQKCVQQRGAGGGTGGRGVTMAGVPPSAALSRTLMRSLPRSPPPGSPEALEALDSSLIARRMLSFDLNRDGGAPALAAAARGGGGVHACGGAAGLPTPRHACVLAGRRAALRRQLRSHWRTSQPRRAAARARRRQPPVHAPPHARSPNTHHAVRTSPPLARGRRVPQSRPGRRHRRARACVIRSSSASAAAPRRARRRCVTASCTSCRSGVSCSSRRRAPPARGGRTATRGASHAHWCCGAAWAGAPCGARTQPRAPASRAWRGPRARSRRGHAPLGR